MTSKYKSYKFRYENGLGKVLQYHVSTVVNIFLPVLLSFALQMIISLLGLSQYVTVDSMFYLTVFSFFVGFVFAIIYTVKFKGVILYDDHLEICRYTLVNNVPKMVIKIDYNEIRSVYNSYYNLRADRAKARKSLLYFGDCKNYIELTIRGGRMFLFSIENQKDFVEEIVKRANLPGNEED